tara:strand:+ start:836 stop:1066 length:231 start_codon:yes stop_codon:yes gene_type:complete
MAWVPVLNKANQNTEWQYENTATASNTYSDANGSYSGGIRTFTFANGNVQQTYVRCRKAGETIERGELSRDFFEEH